MNSQYLTSQFCRFVDAMMTTRWWSSSCLQRRISSQKNEALLGKSVVLGEDKEFFSYPKSALLLSDAVLFSTDHLTILFTSRMINYAPRIEGETLSIDLNPTLVNDNLSKYDVVDTFPRNETESPTEKFSCSGYSGDDISKIKLLTSHCRRKGGLIKDKKNHTLDVRFSKCNAVVIYIGQKKLIVASANHVWEQIALCVTEKDDFTYNDELTSMVSVTRQSKFG